MGGRAVIRVLALASTPRGFGFVVLEGTWLVDWGLRRCPPASEQFRRRIDALVRRYQPVFGVVESLSGTTKRCRGRIFIRTATTTLKSAGILVVPVSARRAAQFAGGPRPSKWDIASAIARRFPEMSHRLPRCRKPWEGEDERVGLFMAAGFAMLAWEKLPPSSRGGGAEEA